MPLQLVWHNFGGGGGDKRSQWSTKELFTLLASTNDKFV